MCVTVEREGEAVGGVAVKRSWQSGGEAVRKAFGSLESSGHFRVSGRTGLSFGPN